MVGRLETFSMLIRKHILIAFAVMLETLSYSRRELMTEKLSIGNVLISH